MPASWKPASSVLMFADTCGQGLGGASTTRGQPALTMGIQNEGLNIDQESVFWALVGMTHSIGEHFAESDVSTLLAFLTPATLTPCGHDLCLHHTSNYSLCSK